MLYVIIHKILYVLIRLFFKLKLHGLKNIPVKGAFIIASNHVSNFDPVIIGSAVPYLPYYMAKEELFKNRAFALLLKSVHAFPVRRDIADKRALKKVIETLRSGEVLLMFPEGTRSKDDVLKEAKRGIAFLSIASRVPVIPCYVEGSNLISPTKGKFNLGTAISVSFGEAIEPPSVENEKNKRFIYDEFSKRIMLNVRQLQYKYK